VASRHLITILVFLYLLVFNEVGYVDEHSAGIHFPAADILIKGVENFVDLNGESAGLGLAFAMTGRFFPQLTQVFAAHGGG